MELTNYIVFYDEVVIFKSNEDVPAIQFALALHQSCNVPHQIEVHEDSFEGELVLLLYKPVK